MTCKTNQKWNVMHRPVYGVQPTPAKDGDEYQRFPLITIRRLSDHD